MDDVDADIQKTIESMLGPNVRIVDCERISSVREEEQLLINGVPIQLDGPDGEAIRGALKTGTVPPCDMINRLLFRAGIVRHPVRLDTSLSVTSTLVTREEVTVARDGRILDERATETTEDNCYSSSSTEVWEPVGRVVVPPQATATIARACVQNDNDHERIIKSATMTSVPAPSTRTVSRASHSVEPSSSSSLSSTASSSSSTSAVRVAQSSAASLLTTSSSVCSGILLASASADSVDDASMLSSMSLNNIAETTPTQPFDSGHDDLFSSGADFDLDRSRTRSVCYSPKITVASTANADVVASKTSPVLTAAVDTTFEGLAKLATSLSSCSDLGSSSAGGVGVASAICATVVGCGGSAAPERSYARSRAQQEMVGV